MGHAYRIVNARPRDLRSLADIERAAAALLAGHAPASVLNETTSEHDLGEAQAEGRLWVALDGETPVGFAHVEILDPGAAHLEEVDVHPDHGRRGLGSLLVAAVCDWAARAGYPEVTLTTFRDVAWNMPFYARLGFAEVPTREWSASVLAVVEDETRRGLDPTRRVVMRRRSTTNPIDLLFGGMNKLGPGDDAHTRRALRSLPRSRFDVVVDAGCGTGRQTLVVAQELDTLVHAVDSYEPFLAHLERRAKAAGVANLVRTHCLDMKEIPRVFPRVDLLWSEGAAYNLGFGKALATWASAIAPGGFAVVSELCWFREDAPDSVREFFATAYPEMKTLEKNAEIAEGSGYELLERFTLPPEAWVEGYYDTLEPRAKALLDHPDEAVRGFASETLREIRVFEQSAGSYGYVFYRLRRR